MRLLSLRTVLVATDLEPSSDAALDSACRLAASAGATLHVIHALADARDRDRSADAVRAVLDRAKASVDHTKLHLIPGSAVEVIRSLADRLSADVIVLGPHRERDGGRAGTSFGSTAQAVITRTFAPCLVARRPLRLPLERVLAPIDLSESARGALLVALSWASALRVTSASGGRTSLAVLHVSNTAESEVPGAAAVERELQTVQRGAGDWAGVEVRGIQKRSADVVESIARFAAEEKADLVVLGTRGLSADDVARLGSVSARLAERVSLPVLLVPPGVWRAHAANP